MDLTKVFYGIQKIKTLYVKQGKNFFRMNGDLLSGYY